MKSKSSPIQVIFNPSSGVPGDEGPQLLSLLQTLQNMDFQPRVFFLQPGCDLAGTLNQALADGIHHFAACGGDGTIDSVADILAEHRLAHGSQSQLCILPAGTQNNIALSLGIPNDILGAVQLLNQGTPKFIDMARAVTSHGERLFFEACTVGLLSALFPMADDIQHGNLPRVADLLATLMSFPLADFQITADDQPAIQNRGHVALVSNTPIIGPHFTVPSASPMDDGLLDVLVFNDLAQLDLAAYAALLSGTLPGQKAIQHYHARKITFHTSPPMPVLADGFHLGSTPLSIEIIPASIQVLTPSK